MAECSAVLRPPGQRLRFYSHEPSRRPSQEFLEFTTTANFGHEQHTPPYRPNVLQDLRLALRRFAAERDWDQFHSPKNLALTAEAAETVL